MTRYAMRAPIERRVESDRFDIATCSWFLDGRPFRQPEAAIAHLRHRHQMYKSEANSHLSGLLRAARFAGTA